MNSEGKCLERDIVDGVTIRLRCPSLQVFNQEMNYCDYPEVCFPQEEQRHSVAAPSSKPQISFVCPESTGVFSLGCTSNFVEKDKPAADTPVPTAAPSTYRISNECKDLSDGIYGSHCGSSFAVCANGVAYTMNCPSDLVFDAKNNRCVFSKDCGEKSAGKKHGEVTAALHSPQNTRGDCIGKPDGLHSLGCVGEFLQCVGGRTYSLHCPAGLVFVERLSVCDETSTCKQLHRPKNVSSPLAHEPLVSSSPEDTECEAEGYFAHFCSVEFYNCVHGKLFAGKCPAGLVFNSDKSLCENVESSEDRPDGVISELDCQPHFTTCLAGTAFVTNCPAGLVYSVKAKLCDYPDACGKEQHSSVAPAAEPTQTAAVHYQDTNACVLERPLVP
ncbi:unnamed protein product [Cylicocyclus nassatus]|uniref:Chitin-binding type-2 domain-containing protein n=1 Tax=Cylicocyclus nassatus TaxID=53992 RepID=A0AA36HIL3_CYLNA|nr:unnamed protein product [Cylicocyclus nassatus]